MGSIVSDVKTTFLMQHPNIKLIRVTQGTVLCVTCAIGAKNLAKVGIRNFAK